MTTSRQLLLDAFEYNKPEKIPVVYHPSPAGLYVHGKKLLDLFNAYPPDNPITFDSIPAPPAETIDENGRYVEIKKDEWGTEWEHLIYGVYGHPKKYPLVNWQEARDYGFPPISKFAVSDKETVRVLQKNYLLFEGWISIFERLHALRPIDEVLLDLCTENEHLIYFLDRFVEYWLTVIDKLIDTGIDVITFGDDWGAQFSSLVSPDLFRRVFKPRYKKLMDPIKKANRKIFFHSCGFLGEILDDLFELGIDGLWPQITLYENDPMFTQKCKDNQVAIYIHPDRQNLVPLGTPHSIEMAIRHYAERYHQLGGGGIFYIEMENDAPFENVEALVKAVHKYRIRD